MKINFLTVAGAALCFITANAAFAGAPPPVPEIDGSLASQVMTMLGGAFLLYRGARK